MRRINVGVGVVAYLFADVALAGVPLGQPLGIALGTALGTALPIVGSLGALAVALVVGIKIVRRKR
jgi:hypothetical protein